jgi:hypothetical protein
MQASYRTATPGRMVTAAEMTSIRMMKQPTHRALGGKRGHCGVGAVHGGESDDPILALMRYHNLPVTRQDYLNVAYLGHPPEELSAEEEADLPKAVRQA